VAERGSRVSENARTDEDAIRAGTEANGDIDHETLRREGYQLFR
jgi:hypothetical protein